MKSIMQTDDSICYICGKPITSNRDLHHVFNGAYKKRSENDGMLIWAHHCCHMWLHEHPISNKTIKARAERIWRSHYGKTKEEFIERYGKSYEADEQGRICDVYDIEEQQEG